jgi:hypothetical protein
VEVTIIGVDNSKKDDKLQLRWKMLHRLGGVNGRHVFESHAGHGVMYDGCYQGADSVFRCEIRQECEGPGIYYMPAQWAVRAVDLQPYTIFDIDPYRNPWEIVWVISQRRKFKKGEKIGFVVTDGFICAHLRLAKTLPKAGFTRQMLDATGWNPEGETDPYMTSKKSQEAARAFFASWFDGRIEWFATVCGGATVNYHAVVLSYD